MPCLYCGRRVPLIRQISDRDFCSDEHRTRYRTLSNSVLDRLGGPLAAVVAEANPRPDGEPGLAGPLPSWCCFEMRALPGSRQPAVAGFAAEQRLPRVELHTVPPDASEESAAPPPAAIPMALRPGATPPPVHATVAAAWRSPAAPPSRRLSEAAALAIDGRGGGATPPVAAWLRRTVDPAEPLAGPRAAPFRPARIEPPNGATQRRSDASRRAENAAPPAAGWVRVAVEPAEPLAAPMPVPFRPARIEPPNGATQRRSDASRRAENAAPPAAGWVRVAVGPAEPLAAPVPVPFRPARIEPPNGTDRRAEGAAPPAAASIRVEPTAARDLPVPVVPPFAASPVLPRAIAGTVFVVGPRPSGPLALAPDPAGPAAELRTALWLPQANTPSGQSRAEAPPPGRSAIAVRPAPALRTAQPVILPGSAAGIGGAEAVAVFAPAYAISRSLPVLPHLSLPAARAAASRKNAATLEALPAKADWPVSSRVPALRAAPQPHEFGTPPPKRPRLQWKRVPVWVRASAAAAVLLAACGFALAPAVARTAGETLRERSALEFMDDFRQGMGLWRGAEAWVRTPGGMVRPAGFATLRLPRPVPEYDFEFLGQIKSHGITWVFRASDEKNYYAGSLVVRKPGPVPEYALRRWAVVGGRADTAVEVPLPRLMRNDTPYRITVAVRREGFATFVEGQMADRWADDRLTGGSAGFLVSKEDQPFLYWVKISSHNDWLGRLCASLAPGKQGWTE